MDPEDRINNLLLAEAISPETADAMRAGLSQPSPGGISPEVPGIVGMPAGGDIPIQSGQGLANVPMEAQPPEVVPEDERLNFGRPPQAVSDEQLLGAASAPVARARNVWTPERERQERELAGAEAGTEESIGKLRENADKRAEVQRRAAEEEAEIRRKRDLDRTIAAETLNEIEDRKQADLSEREARMAATREDIANSKVVDRRTKGQRVAGAIATALGSLAQGHYAAAGIRMDNLPAKLVRERIERDLQEQREALENKRAGLRAQQSEYGVVSQRYDNEYDKAQIGWAMIADGYIEQLEGVRDNAKREDVAITAQGAIDEIEAERKAKIEDVERQHAQRVELQELGAKQRLGEQHARARNAQRKAAAGEPVDPKRLAKFAKDNRHFFTSMKRDIPVVQKYLQSKDLDGAGFFGGRTPGRALSKDAREARAAVQGLFQSILRDESGAVIGKDEIVGKGRAAGLEMNENGTVDWSQSEESIRQGLSRLVQEAELKAQSVIAQDEAAAAALLGNMEALGRRPTRTPPEGGKARKRGR